MSNSRTPTGVLQKRDTKTQIVAKRFLFNQNKQWTSNFVSYIIEKIQIRVFFNFSASKQNQKTYRNLSSRRIRPVLNKY